MNNQPTLSEAVIGFIIITAVFLLGCLLCTLEQTLGY